MFRFLLLVALLRPGKGKGRGSSHGGGGKSKGRPDLAGHIQTGARAQSSAKRLATVPGHAARYAARTAQYQSSSNPKTHALGMAMGKRLVSAYGSAKASGRRR